MKVLNIVVLPIVALFAAAQQPNVSALRVQACDLVERSDEYNGKLVELDALITRVPHAGVIVPKGCVKEGPNDIALVLPAKPSEQSERLLKTLRKHAASAHVVGTFHAGSVYGGGNCCLYELQAVSISEVKRTR